ncbi:hypothetical protein BC938DRAFT_470833 [Jimgerdemannia flammicorona]|uniref:Uncharacterized protein n=1 Tax=Jimgerdemannia flammicorona TaxID=994334 RepID=A0A433QV01_9FUNG|nr:hypothetical protein BC938DRAFT_470833 [Jimgerdemannia flammicorona]
MFEPFDCSREFVYYAPTLFVKKYSSRSISRRPLFEPSSLKKKFDNIFACIRYTKAIDIIKSFAQRTYDIRPERMKLEYLQSNKLKAEETCNRLETTRVQIDSYHNSVGEL